MWGWKCGLPAIWLVLLILPPASASGFGVSPGILNFSNMLKGTTAEKTFTISNTGSEQAVYELSIAGRGSEWFSFPESRIIVPGSSNVVAAVKADIPSDAANGQYDQIIYVKAVPKESTGTGTGMGIIQSVGIRTALTVTGSEIIDGTITKITTRDAEIGDAVVFTIGFTNNGNVMAGPEVRIAVFSEDGTQIDYFKEEPGLVNPGATADLEASWSTSGRQAGKYTAEAEAYLKGKLLGQKKLTFSLFEKGFFKRSGELVLLKLAGPPEKGKPAKIQAKFRNTGESGIDAKLKAEVYLDNSLAATAESDSLLIDPGQEKTLEAFFTPEQPGKYMIKAKVLFGGRETTQKTAFFTISFSGKAKITSTRQGIPATFIIAGIVMLLIIAGLIYWVWWY